jgi:hypothetical protein
MKVITIDTDDIETSSWEKIQSKYHWSAEFCDLSKTDAQDDLLELVKTRYPEADEGFPEYFQWEYLNNPAGRAFLWLAKHENRIIAQCATIPIRVKIGDQVWRYGLAAKSITRQDFEGKGIHLFLTRKVLETCHKNNLAFLGGFPNSKAYRSLIKRKIVQKIGRVPLLIRPLRPGRLFEKHTKQIRSLHYLKWPAVFILRTYFLILQGIVSMNLFFLKSRGLRIVRGARFDDSVDTFWDKAKGNFENMIIRDKEFLNWRYCANPRRRYAVFFSQNKKKDVVGYIVLGKASIEGLQTGFIIDILALQGNEGRAAVDQLLMTAHTYFKDEDVDSYACLMPRHAAYYSFLLRHGFLACPKQLLPHPFTMTMAVTSEDVPKGVNSFKKWFVTLGDFDVV